MNEHNWRVRKTGLIALALTFLIGSLSGLPLWNGNRAYAAQMKWKTVGNAGFTAGAVMYSKMAVDNGIPYVIYRDETSQYMKVMKYTPADGWQMLNLAGIAEKPIYFTSLLVHNGVPYIAYLDPANSYYVTVLRYSEETGWESVGSTNTSGDLPVLAMDQSGTLYLAFCTSPTAIKVMKLNPTTGSWEACGTEFNLTDSFRNFSLKVDNGVPFVIYQTLAGPGSIANVVMKYEDNAWSKVGDTLLSAYNASLAVYEHTPYLAYSDPNQIQKASVVAFTTGSGWTPVGSYGFTANRISDASIAFDAAGTPFVAFSGGMGSYNATVMKYNKTGQWELVGNGAFSPGNTREPSLALDNGLPYLSFLDENSGKKLTVMKPDLTYTVTYDGNGATGGTAPVDSKGYGSQEAVTAANPGSLTRTGYAFAGWNTAKDGSGASYQAGSVFPNPGSDITLYATWITLEVTVSYNPGDHGTLSGASQETLKYGELPAQVPGVTPDSGYQFAGWSSDGGSTKRSSADLLGIPVNASVTYTAYYTPLPKGDGNGDGKVTSEDWLMLNRFLKGKIKLTPEQQQALDMNGDGKLDATDAQLILDAYTGEE